MENEKIFYIGFPKTGTKSMGALFEQLGYKVKSFDDSYKQELWDYVVEKDLTPFFNMVDDYNAFEDIPWCYIFKEIYAKFHGSKFIYHYRKEESWYRSIVRHGKRAPLKKNMLDYLYKYNIPEIQDEKEKRIAIYRYHKKDVLNFFRDKKDRFLSVDLFNDENVVKEICDFLGKDSDIKNMPHNNIGNKFLRAKSKIMKLIKGRLGVGPQQLFNMITKKVNDRLF